MFERFRELALRYGISPVGIYASEPERFFPEQADEKIVPYSREDENQLRQRELDLLDKMNLVNQPSVQQRAAAASALAQSQALRNNYFYATGIDAMPGIYTKDSGQDFQMRIDKSMFDYLFEPPKPQPGFTPRQLQRAALLIECMRKVPIPLADIAFSITYDSEKGVDVEIEIDWKGNTQEFHVRFRDNVQDPFLMSSVSSRANPEFTKRVLDSLRAYAVHVITTLP